MYVVIAEDRHVDVEVDLFTDKDKAIEHARTTAKEHCRHDDCYHEVDVKGWLFCAEFSCGESDNVHIIEKEVDGCFKQDVEQYEPTRLKQFHDAIKQIDRPVGIVTISEY